MGRTPTQQNDKHYGARESQQRFKKLVDVALKTPPKPIKSMEPKGVPAQSKRRRTKKAVKAA